MNAHAQEPVQELGSDPRENTIPSINADKFDLIASQFRVLGEPVRLKLLNTLQGGERTVNELAALARTTQANASRLLRVLTESGFVERQRRSSFVYYSLADESVVALCNILKVKLQEDFKNKSQAAR